MLSEKDSGTLSDILRHIDLAEQFAAARVTKAYATISGHSTL